MTPTPDIATASPTRTLSVITMGCARNDVDSEELAGRLSGSGWAISDEDPDVVVVNTCGFIDAAKKDSIDAILAAADDGTKVVAVGCLAQRYGAELAAELPEAAAVLGFDDYADIGDRLDDVLAGRPLVPHSPVDRRTLLPLSPVDRPAAAHALGVPGHGDARSDAAVAGPASGPRVVRTRLVGGPMAPLKLASGCDRRCTFCAIPSFRGSFLSRPPADVLAEATWLAADGVKEIVLVSENSTSYGKDLGDVRLLESLLPRLGEIEGLDRFRVAYLQPAEIRPGLLEAVLTTPKAAQYLDISFQHSSEPVLRRMKRFGSTDAFLGLIARARELRPDVGIRTNVIVGFPGETEADLDELERFLSEGGLDAVGVFGYSDEDGTAAVSLPDKHPVEVIDERVARFSALVEELTAQRAEDRIGQTVRVLVEEVDGGTVEGRAEQQGPEVDGTTTLVGVGPAATGLAGSASVSPGDVVVARVISSDGIDLVALPVGTTSPFDRTE